MDFTNKNILVVGGTHGIGLATAEAFASLNASRVCICSRKQVSVNEALNRLRVKFPTCTFEGFAANVGDQTQMRKGLSMLETQQFDVLVSNVGVDPVSGNALDMADQVFDKIFDTNVKAAWMLMKDIVPRMAGRVGASIILVSSTGGYQPSLPSGLYGVSKLALIALTKAIASELTEIRINCVAPGLVKTRMSEAFWKGPYRKVAEEALFTHRLGEPDDIAKVICFLASNSAGWITGETIVVSGGTHTRL